MYRHERPSGSCVAPMLSQPDVEQFIVLERRRERDWKEVACTVSNVFQEDVVDYFEKKVFVSLLPALEQMLVGAHDQNVLRVQKCRFNGLDYLAEILWNRNPRHSREARTWLDAFSIPPFKLHLHSRPRPLYPKSWLWSEEEAALRLQKYVRGWLTRKREDVSEMRQFWRELAKQKKRVASTTLALERRIDGSNGGFAYPCVDVSFDGRPMEQNVN